MILGYLCGNLFLILFIDVGSTMTWYVVFCGWRPGVYESWGVCSDYILGFSGVV
jgi:viroplasmin and RNaseH domain-containing protein